MAFCKISRIACGGEFHRDNYLDAAVYIATAFEATVSVTDRDARTNNESKLQEEKAAP